MNRPFLFLTLAPKPGHDACCTPGGRQHLQLCATYHVLEDRISPHFAFQLRLFSMHYQPKAVQWGGSRLDQRFHHYILIATFPLSQREAPLVPGNVTSAEQTLCGPLVGCGLGACSKNTLRGVAPVYFYERAEGSVIINTHIGIVGAGVLFTYCYDKSSHD